MYGRGYQSGGLGFGPPITPDVVKQLLAANFAIFVLQLLSYGWTGGDVLTDLGALTPREFWHGSLWQPCTYMFLHGGLGHVAMNMLMLWMFGSPLALAWGARRFLRLYFACGVGAGLIIATLPYVLGAVGLHFPSLSANIPTLGASGAIFGVLLAYSFTFPNRTIVLIFPPVAFRAIWLIPILFLLEVMFGPANVSHVGHLGGALVAWLWMSRESDHRLLPSVAQIKLRWRRMRMRKRLRAVQREESDWRARGRRDRDRDDRTLH
ncbi:MAG TPA: rhomboid family intramembrane serine protease [Myxococcota bacterium]|jgi:membrane associated rhomboid family serine protease|nr:rhomboid family intramembrane serine protease [Myxococcota bacterium]